jgi:hypothetical protein
VLLETNVELTSINLSVSVVGVELSEGSAQPSDGGGSSGVELLSKSVEDYMNVTVSKLLQFENIIDIERLLLWIPPLLPGVDQGRAPLL